MYHMYGTQYAGRDVTKYKYMVSLLCPKSLVHTRKNNAKETDEIVDQYVVFATNMKITNKSKLIKTIPETCCKRWIIEAGYIVTKNTTPKTTSNAL